MAYSKASEFTRKEQELALLAKALSHPARLQILKILANRTDCVCGEIVEVLPLAQSTVSRHLMELAKAGLISGTVEGPRSCYCLNRKNFQKLGELFGELLEQVHTHDSRNKCC